MEENKLTHRAGLVREAAEILNRYTCLLYTSRCV